MGLPQYRGSTHLRSNPLYTCLIKIIFTAFLIAPAQCDPALARFILQLLSLLFFIKLVLARNTCYQCRLVCTGTMNEVIFVFVEYLCNRSPKIKTKNIKNCSSILAIVNHRNWLDDSPPLTMKTLRK